MQYHGRILTSMLLLCAVATVSDSSLSRDLSGQRQDYTGALEALELDQWAQYEQLRRGLEDYPLAIYLDYFALTRQIDSVQPDSALQFLARSADTPLSNQFLTAYLRAAGRAQRWQDFLHVMAVEPNSVDLKCYYFRAQLAQGNKALAWEGASRLWVVGESLPPACDLLFDAWQSTGALTDDIVWTRLLNAFAARQPALLQFVSTKSSPQLTPWSDQLLDVYQRPESLADLHLPADKRYSADIASHGLAYLAASNPAAALSYWTDLKQQLPFSAEQVRTVEYAIAQQSLFSRTTAHNAWLDGALVRLADDKLIGIRLRWALSEQDWTAFERNMPLLSAAAREENVWRYWQAVVQQRRGATATATAALEHLAGERDYYGFLAAEKLGRPYALKHQRLVMSDASSAPQLPAVLRIEELHFHRKESLAQAEWFKLLQASTDTAQQQDLALLASQKGWYRMAIDAATAAGAWDALDQRFPAAYQSTFKQHAAAVQVPRTELMAIARRESAFFPGAQSPVGARGLMQIMPATGVQVAASLQQTHHNADLFDVDHNVLLGSTYYRQLLDRFDGNRVFALTAYNAGPHRVDRWRHAVGEGEGVPVDVWIETIPYLETRHYVQAVLAYNVVFQYLLRDTQNLLTPLERQASY